MNKNTSEFPEEQWRPQAPFSYHPSETLALLEQLIDVASSLSYAVSRRHDLSTSEVHILRHLYAEPLGPAELARRLGITSAATSGAIDRLEARGYVHRSPHPSDRRRTVVVPTRQGMMEAMGDMTAMFEQLAQLDASLNDHDRQVVETFLSHAIAAMKSIL